MIKYKEGFQSTEMYVWMFNFRWLNKIISVLYYLDSLKPLLTKQKLETTGYSQIKSLRVLVFELFSSNNQFIGGCQIIWN